MLSAVADKDDAERKVLWKPGLEASLRALRANIEEERTTREGYYDVDVLKGSFGSSGIITYQRMASSEVGRTALI
jgi:hypothetical protein